MVEIIDAKDSDSADVLEIFIKARGEMKYLPILHTLEETREFIENLVGSGHVTLGIIDGKTVGFIHVQNGWINHLYIDPKFQNRGVGKELLSRAKKQNSELSLWVFEKNKKAIKFYEREGFNLVEKRDKSKAENEENLPDRKYIWKDL